MVLVDPHTAVGIGAASSPTGESPKVALATAHPAKFPDAVERAIGVRPELPERLADLFDRRERFEVLPAEVEASGPTSSPSPTDGRLRGHRAGAGSLTSRSQAVRVPPVRSATLRNVKYVVCVPDGCADLLVAASRAAPRSRWRRCPRWPPSRRGEAAGLP